jgi:hypothetical protein
MSTTTIAAQLDDFEPAPDGDVNGAYDGAERPATPPPTLSAEQADEVTAWLLGGREAY